MATNHLEVICSMPRIFALGNLTQRQALQMGKDLLETNDASVGDISRYLTTHTDLIEDWLTWSENKRVEAGWFFSHSGENYIVGKYPSGPRYNFLQPAEACAQFIMREVRGN